jgi:HAE1 family hydrophobic/amphiphilic exporter-1
MLVDNSIVVLESIYRKRKLGVPLARAAVDGTDEVAAAVAASTLTSVAVFLPIVFVEGIAGQLFRDQAVTVSVSHMASLAVALTLIPDALALWEPASRRRRGATRESLLSASKRMLAATCPSAASRSCTIAWRVGRSPGSQDHVSIGWGRVRGCLPVYSAAGRRS